MTIDEGRDGGICTRGSWLIDLPAIGNDKW